MVVVDASVIFKWFIKEEPDFEIAFKLFQDHISKKEVIIVPSILFYEIANALVTKSQINQREIDVYLNKLEQSQIQIVEFDFNQIKQTAKLAKQYKVAVYDAAYAVLARNKKCKLITADKKFVQQVNLSFVEYLGEVS